MGLALAEREARQWVATVWCKHAGLHDKAARSIARRGFNLGRRVECVKAAHHNKTSCDAASLSESDSTRRL